MKKTSHIFLLYLQTALLLFSLNGLCQEDNIPVNTWRSHLNYSNAISVAIADNEVFCASNNALFSYEKASGVISTISKEDGLSDSDILTLGYASPSDQLIVLYKNGNIDFISETDIVNMRTVLNSNYPNKEFYGLRMDKQYMYICASFGIVKINTENYIIEETYDFIGENGSENAVYDISISEDSLYIASAEGIKSVADDEVTNKQDYSNWNLIVPVQNSTKSLLYTDNGIYYTDDNLNQLLKFENNTSSSIFSFGTETAFKLDFWGDDIVLPISTSLKIIDPSDNVSTWSDPKSPNPRQILDDEEGKAWIADNINGLISVSENGQEIEGYAPSGPLYPTAYQIINAGELIAITPAESNNVQVGSFSIFKDGQWKNYTSLERTGSISIQNTAPLYGMAYNEIENKIYFASDGDGLLVYNINDESIELIKKELLVDGNSDAHIKSLSFDQYGNLWTSSPGWVHYRNSDGEWQHARDSKLSAGAIATQNSLQNDTWFVLPNNRLMVFKENNSRYINTDQTNGGLPSATVYTIDLDRVGSMWIGTDDGAAEYYGISPVEAGNFEVSLPRYDGFPLLRGEKVQTITTDGGNRKWIGTGRGLWLFSKDGGTLYDYFTVENSSLLSDNITSLAVQPVSGEVFIASDNGIVSYRSDATDATSQFKDVKIFPSPVRPNYQGVLTITGLVKDASVKITDSAGNLVWDGQAFGGGVSWNLRLNDNQRPSSGVYFVFATDFDGNEKYAGKFAVIR
ncbi:hypothetical protein EI427_02045 [Flammeovirga pectinis]|uniref:PorZ N-terminal beta-propeller domain-containing protein n=1 Tax=Flammeovirga pectinis TaxID=2494373 RepID=A0A3Q9FL41_9BACT|nr:hypothetical protein [Flammeovirga pectinis]AZQ61040.1 hypothetical protein EI427_02045 [Flammeovirga pectinis]